MVSVTSNYSPSFSGVHEHSSFKLLGTQGKRSLEIINPLLKKMGNDCDFVLGATPNKELGNKPTLTIICQNLNTAGNGFLSKITRFFSTVNYVTAQSSTEAVSPYSIYANAANAKMTLPTSFLRDFTEDADAFFSKPEIAAAVKTYEQGYTKTPTASDIRFDERRAFSTAKANGHCNQYPFLGQTQK